MGGIQGPSRGGAFAPLASFRVIDAAPNGVV